MMHRTWFLEVGLWNGNQQLAWILLLVTVIKSPFSALSTTEKATSVIALTTHLPNMMLLVLSGYWIDPQCIYVIVFLIWRSMRLGHLNPLSKALAFFATINQALMLIFNLLYLPAVRWHRSRWWNSFKQTRPETGLEAWLAWCLAWMQFATETQKDFYGNEFQSYVDGDDPDEGNYRVRRYQ
jgi:hypothetical protein